MQFWAAKPCSLRKFATGETTAKKSPDLFDELSQSKDDCSPPRKRFEDCNWDDNVSLYADDDLDCDSSVKSSLSEKTRPHWREKACHAVKKPC